MGGSNENKKGWREKKRGGPCICMWRYWLHNREHHWTCVKCTLKWLNITISNNRGSKTLFLSFQSSSTYNHDPSFFRVVMVPFHMQFRRVVCFVVAAFCMLLWRLLASPPHFTVIFIWQAIVSMGSCHIGPTFLSFPFMHVHLALCLCVRLVRVILGWIRPLLSPFSILCCRGPWHGPRLFLLFFFAPCWTQQKISD